MKRPCIFLWVVMVSLCTASTPAFSAGFQLPDTGQHTCYDESGEISCPDPGGAFYGQDAHFQGLEHAYQNHGNGTITDSVTGLMWQQAPGDIDGDDVSSWVPACDYCDSLDYAGHTDWRMPNRRELMSLVDYGRYDPAINPVFSGGAFTCWSGSHFIFNTYEAWYVSFDLGEVSHAHKNYPYYHVRCVRGGSFFITPRFQVHGDGTVTDLDNGLMWQQGDTQNDSGGRTWQEALAYCEQCTQAGYTDWHLPSIRQLESLVDFNRFGDYETMDPVFAYRRRAYWSSTTNIHKPIFAWYVGFYYGTVGHVGQSPYDNALKVSPGYVRCVRTGPGKSSPPAMPWLYLLLLDDEH
jgi:hypothetical protein